MSKQTKSSVPIKKIVRSTKGRALPKKIQVLNINVKVLCDNTFLESSEDSNTEFGLTLPEEQAMIIREEMEYDMESDTVFHETGHWVLYLTGASQTIPHKKEEQFIASYTSAMLDTLRKNKSLRTYLFGD